MKKLIILITLFLSVLVWTNETLAQPYCNQAQGTPGFASNLTCQNAVCVYDSWCCSTSWDGVCASEANTDPNCVQCLTPPANDLCAGAITVTCGSVIIANTYSATSADAPATCGTTLNTGPGVWYTFIGTGDAIEINTCGAATNYDTKLGIFTGTCGALTCVTGNDDEGSCGYGGGFSSKVVFCSTLGTQYYIYVTGYSTNEGVFELAINCIPSPSIVSCPANITQDNDEGVCGGTVSVPIPVAGVDYQNALSMTNDFTGTGDASGFYNGGATTITWTANGYCASTTCVQTITINDTTAPSITCSADVVVSNDLDSCDAVVTFGDPIVVENCALARTELLVNGDFESGATAPWSSIGTGGMGGCDLDFVVYTGNSDPCGYSFGGVNFTPNGTYGIHAALDGSGPITRELRQALTLPAMMTSAELSFNQAYYVDLATYCSGCTGTRLLEVRMLDATGTIELASLYNLSFAPGGMYSQVFAPFNVDVQAALAPYVGQNVILSYLITVPEVATGPAMYAIDNVSLECVASSFVQTAGLSSGSTFPIGTTVNVYEATDASGNISTCSQNVTVQDTQDPEICEPVLGIVSIVTMPSLSQPPFSVLSGGMLSGRPHQTGSCCSAEDPMTDLLIFTVDTTGVYNISQVQTGGWDGYLLLYTDPLVLNVAPPTTFVGGDDDGSGGIGTSDFSATLNAGQTYYLYTTGYYTAENGPFVTSFSGAGNVWAVANPCQTDIIIPSDSAICGAVFSYPACPVSDNCAGVTVALTDGVASGATFPLGSTEVEYTATDASGNTETYTFYVTVLDVSSPVVYAPADITVPSDSGLCSASGVMLGYASAVDNCGAIDTIFNNALEPYQMGANYILWTAIDTAGNYGYATQTVTVIDTVAPVMVCPADTTVPYDSTICGAIVNYTLPVSNDLCSSATMTQSTDPTTITMLNSISCASGPQADTNAYLRAFDLSTLGISGSIHVNMVRFGIETADALTGSQDAVINLYTVTDTLLYGNMTLIASQPITITDQSQTFFYVPISVSVPSDSILVIELFVPNAVNVDSNTFLIGSNSNGESGLSYLMAPSCGILEPMDMPILGLPFMNILLDFSYDMPVVTSLYTGIGTGGTFPVGLTTETYESTDFYGNSSYCSFDVYVADTNAPTITCPGNTTAVTDAGLCTATVVLPAPLSFDHCGIVSEINDAPLTYPVGVTTVNWTVEDNGGNTATCAVTVTVTDNEDPTISCPVNVAVANDPGFNYATGVVLGTPVTDDNCGVFSVVNDGVEPYVPGNTNVIWTVTDINGNTQTCTQIVTVNSTYGIENYDADGDALQNDPNPFHTTTNIVYVLHAQSMVSLKVLDMVGQTVAVIVDEKSMSAGAHTEQLDAAARHMACGVYYLQLTIDDKTLVRKMVVN